MHDAEKAMFDTSDRVSHVTNLIRASADVIGIRYVWAAEHDFVLLTIQGNNIIDSTHAHLRHIRILAQSLNRSTRALIHEHISTTPADTSSRFG